MTVEDVIKMVQVKLADDLIISQVRKNGKPFSLSADDIVRLKTTGANDSVIRVMIDPQAPATPPAPDADTAILKGTRAQPSSPLPSSYGYYVLDNQKLSQLGQAQVVTKFGLTLADRGFAVDGISSQALTPRVESLSPTIIVYQQNVSASALQLSALSFVRSMKAYQFNIINTAPQFFSNVYRKDPNETVPIDLWRPSRDVQMRIEPVEGKTGMYKLVPSAPLEVGKYALYYPDSLHANDIVFSASVGRQAVVVAFEVVRSEGSVSPSRGRAAGVLYLAKSDGSMIPLTKQEASLRWAFGAKKTVDVRGVRSDVRFRQNDKSSFLVSTPPMGWATMNRNKVYVFEVKNGKRTAAIKKTGFTFSIESFGSGGQFVKLIPQGDLAPGEYAFGPSDPDVPNDVPNGEGRISVITFGVDPSGGSQ